MTWLGGPMTTFNYDIVAELFPTRNDVELFSVNSRRGKRPPLGYGRFARAAYAIRFAIEELRPTVFRSRAWRSTSRYSTAMEFADCTTVKTTRWSAA